MAAENGNGVDHGATVIDTIFQRESKDMGVVAGLGHVILREAPLSDIWPYLGGDAENVQSFGLRMLAASIEINGHRISFEQLQGVGMRKLRILQSLLPEVQRINGMGMETTEAGEGEEKNVDAAGSTGEANPADSPSGTDS